MSAATWWGSQSTGAKVIWVIFWPFLIVRLILAATGSSSSSERATSFGGSEFDFDTLILGQPFDEVVKGFKGKSIELDSTKMSDDVTLSEQLRESSKAREKAKPYKYKISPVRVKGLVGALHLDFDPEKRLTTAIVFVSNFYFQEKQIIDQTIGMPVVASFVDRYTDKFGAPKKEVDEEAYSWEWLKDGIKTSVGATIGGGALKEVQDFNMFRGYWKFSTLELE